MAKEEKEKAPEGGKDAKAEASPEEAAAKSKKKKLIIIIGGGVVLTLAIGGGLAFFLSGGSKEELAAKDGHGEAAEPAAEEHGEKAEGQGEEKKSEHEAAKPKEGGDKKAAEGQGEKKAGEGHGEEKAPEGQGEKKAGEGQGDKDKKAQEKLDGVDFGCTYNFKPFNLNLGNPLENRYVRLEIAVEYGCSEELTAEMEKRLPQLRDAVIAVTSRKTREFLLGPDGKEQLRKEIFTRINQYMTRKIDDVYITDILIE